MNNSQNPSSLRSKKEITDALIKLMQDHPYSEISVKQIVMETSLARKTFYLNFTSKDDVLNSVINQLILEYTIALSNASEGAFTVIFEFCEKNKEMLNLLHKNNMLYLLLLRLNEVIPECNRTMDMRRNPFARTIGNLEPDYIIAFNIGAIWNVIFKWVDRGMTDSLDDIKNTIEQYLSRY